MDPKEPNQDSKDPAGVIDLTNISSDPGVFGIPGKPLVIGEEKELFGVDKIEDFIPVDVVGEKREKLKFALTQFLGDGPKTREQIEKYIKDDSAKLAEITQFGENKVIVGSDTRIISKEDVLDATHINNRSFAVPNVSGSLDLNRADVLVQESMVSDKFLERLRGLVLKYRGGQFGDVLSGIVNKIVNEKPTSKGVYELLMNNEDLSLYESLPYDEYKELRSLLGYPTPPDLNSFLQRENSVVASGNYIVEDTIKKNTSYEQDLVNLDTDLYKLVSNYKFLNSKIINESDIKYFLGDRSEDYIIFVLNELKKRGIIEQSDSLIGVTNPRGKFNFIISNSPEAISAIDSIKQKQQKVDDMPTSRFEIPNPSDLRFSSPVSDSQLKPTETVVLNTRNSINILSNELTPTSRENLIVLSTKGLSVEIFPPKSNSYDQMSIGIIENSINELVNVFTSVDGYSPDDFNPPISKIYISDNLKDISIETSPSGTKVLNVSVDMDAQSIKNYLSKLYPDKNIELDSKQEEIPKTLEPEVVSNQTKEAEMIAEAKERRLLEKLNTLDWDIPQTETVRQDEWNSFKDFQKEHADLEARKNMSLKGSTSVEEHSKLVDEFQEIDRRYSEAMSRVRILIVSTIREEYSGITLSPEQEGLLQSKIKKVLFMEFAEKSQSIYLAKIRELKAETLLGKVVNSGAEALRTIAKTKAFSWYTKQNKWVRLGMTTALATGTGLVLGGLTAGGAITYGGYRLARGAASFGGSALGAIAGENIKSWSIEELNKKEQEEIDTLQSGNFTLEEQSLKLREIRERYEKERRNAKIKKAALTIGAGAGAGMLSGLTESIMNSKVSVLDSSKPKVVDTIKEAPKPVQEVVPPKPVAEAPSTEVTNSFFANKEILVHRVKPGDSLWKILQGTLDNDGRFKGMSEARKTFVLSNLTNKILENPEQYGVGKGGAITVGKNTDLTSLFEDKKEIEDILNKAESIGSVQENNILENNKKIEAWIKANPGKNVDVNEVLSGDVENTVKQGEVLNIDNLDDMQKTLALTFAEGYSDLIKDLKSLPNNNEEINNLIKEVESLKSNLKNVDWNNSQTLGEMQDRMKEIRDKIENLKPDKPDDMALNLENSVAGGASAIGALSVAPNIYSGIRSMKSDVANQVNNGTRAEAPLDVSDVIIENSFKAGIDEIYGNKGILNIGNKSGFLSKEWKEISNLNASEYLVYATKDASKSGLQPEIIAKLDSSKRHIQFKDQLLGLLDQVKDIDFKPYDNETVANFTKRVAGFVYRRYLQSQPKN